MVMHTFNVLKYPKKQQQLLICFKKDIFELDEERNRVRNPTFC